MCVCVCVCVCMCLCVVLCCMVSSDALLPSSVSCVVDFCAAAQFYIVPRKGVFTTCTGLNTGLQRGHPTAIPS